MVKLKLMGDISEFVPGLDPLKPDLPLCFGDDGIPVMVEKGGRMVACLSNKEGKIVRNKDRTAAKALAASAPSAMYALRTLKDAWRELWYATRKTSGFEIIDLRLGALVQRMESAGRRMDLFADGKVDDIEELSAEKLPFATYKDGKIGMVMRWKNITTPSSVM